MNLFGLSGILLGVTCLVLALIVAINGKTKLHRVWFLFNVAVAIWGFGCYFISKSFNSSTALTSWKFAVIGAIFISVLFYHTTCIFCNVERARRKLIILAYIQALFFLMLNFTTNLFVTKVAVIFDSLYYLRTAGLFYPLFFLIWISLVILGHYELIKFYRKSSGIKKKQTLYYLIGVLLGFSGGSTNFLPMFGIDIYPAGNFTIPLYCFICTYAIFRYRLMDIRLVIKKSMVYSLSAGILTGLFIVLVLAMTKYLTGFAGLSSFGITIIAALAIALLFYPLKDRIQSLINRVFYKTTYDYYAAIQKISHELVATIELQRIYRLIVDTVFETVKPQSAYLISLGSESSEIVFSRSVKEKTSIENAGNDLTQLNETSELVKLSKGKTIIIKEELPMVIAEEKAHAVAHDLAPFKGEAAVPLVIEKELAYLLILGEKLSGDAFSNEDIRLLTTVASQSAIALKNARLYDELEQRVQDMTDKILVAEKLESVGILAGGIAHDFNNILTAILGNISLAKVGFDPADKKYQLLTNSEHACLIAKSLSNKLITFSSGGTPMKQPASVEEVMRKALASSCDDHSIRYAVSIAGDLWSVEFDTQQMSEVFHHLILNAQEAMPQGGVITVSAENVLLDAQNPTPLPEGRYIKISIQDQGMGIPKKNLAKIFDPYFTTKQMGAVKGLGLGLAICYSVIRKHGGHISVESELGAGSTFHIYLPA